MDSPVTSPHRQSGFQFDMQSEVQGRFARLSSINIKNFILLSDNATGAGTLSNGQTAGLSSELTPAPPHQFDINFAVPYVAIYQGTTNDANFQIYPTIGGSITPGQWTVQGALDWHLYDGIKSSWGGAITNVSAGASKAILFITQWKWIIYNNTIQG